MPRTKRPHPYVTLEVKIPEALRDRLTDALTPSNFTSPPFGERQRVLMRLIRDFCDETDHRRDKAQQHEQAHPEA